METLKKTFEKISKQENKNHCENIHSKKKKNPPVAETLSFYRTRLCS